MELDLQRFYNINRRILMWIAFFAILYLLHDFFAVMFLTFIMGFMMRKVARFVVATTRAPYWAAVVGPYMVALALLVLMMMTAVPRVAREGIDFSRQIGPQLDTLAERIKESASRYGMTPVLAKYVTEGETDQPATTQPSESISNDALLKRLQGTISNFLPRTSGSRHPLQEVVLKFAVAVSEGAVKFLLAVLLSFLIVLDFEGLRSELYSWRNSPVGRFFHEAASSLVEFSKVVGQAFQCQLIVSLLNTTITCIGLSILDIRPLLLLTSVVFLFGLIPVLGVWISSVPIVLIAFNDHGMQHALLAVGLIVVVHLLEAYIFNPRIYAARFHLNPVIVLIILLVGHELFGVWGMLLGIPVTHYVLNIAQMPTIPRKNKEKHKATVKTDS